MAECGRGRRQQLRRSSRVPRARLALRKSGQTLRANRVALRSLQPLSRYLSCANSRWERRLGSERCVRIIGGESGGALCA
jgi:hypothetical protein